MHTYEQREQDFEDRRQIRQIKSNPVSKLFILFGVMKA